MRSREEIERDTYSKTLSQSPALEDNRLSYLQIEILLDIRDLQEQILEGVYEVDKTVERRTR